MKKSNFILWAIAGAALLWGSVALVSASDGVSMLDYVFYFLGGLAFGAVTVATAVGLLGRGLRKRERLIKILPSPFVIQLVFLVIVFAGVSFDLAFAARFAASRSALEMAATDTRSGTGPGAPTWIGLFKVSEIDKAGNAVRFIIGECGLADDCGVVHSPDGTPPIIGEDWYAPIKGSWWRWRRSW